MTDRMITGLYRLYWLDVAGGVAAMSTPFIAPNDADAVVQAILLADGDLVELWKDAHLVAHLDRAPVPATVH